jgi:hypothetical protein
MFPKPGDRIDVVMSSETSRKQFHERLGALRRANKKLSAEQLERRLQRKPSRGRVNKSRTAALRITVILTMMRTMKGLPLTYTRPAVLCRDPRCKTTIHKAEPRLIHNIHDKDKERAAAIHKELRLLLDLDEFISDHQKFLGKSWGLVEEKKDE